MVFMTVVQMKEHLISDSQKYASTPYLKIGLSGGRAVEQQTLI
jgi:hypothetical protein